MKIDSTAALGLAAIQRGLQGSRENAARIASSEQLESSAPAGPAEPLVALKQNSLQVKAGARVIETWNELIGTLFDDKA